MSGLHFDERVELSHSKLYAWQPPATELGPPWGGTATGHGTWTPSGRDGHRPWSWVPLRELSCLDPTTRWARVPGAQGLCLLEGSRTTQCLASNWKHSQKPSCFLEEKEEELCVTEHWPLATFCWFWVASAIEMQALPQPREGGRGAEQPHWLSGYPVLALRVQSHYKLFC